MTLCSLSLGILTISLEWSSVLDEEDEDTILRRLLVAAEVSEGSSFLRSILTTSDRLLFAGFPVELEDDERLRLRATDKGVTPSWERREDLDFEGLRCRSGV